MFTLTKEEIGAILKKLRTKSGKTQKEVATALGRTQQVVGHWETGYAQPDANTLFILCDLYGASVDVAFGFKKSPEELVYDSVDVQTKEFLEKFNQLNEEGKARLMQALDDLIYSGRYEKNSVNGMDSKKQA